MRHINNTCPIPAFSSIFAAIAPAQTTDQVPRYFTVVAGVAALAPCCPWARVQNSEACVRERRNKSIQKRLCHTVIIVICFCFFSMHCDLHTSMHVPCFPLFFFSWNAQTMGCVEGAGPLFLFLSFSFLSSFDQKLFCHSSSSSRCISCPRLNSIIVGKIPAALSRLRL